MTHVLGAEHGLPTTCGCGRLRRRRPTVPASLTGTPASSHRDHLPVLRHNDHLGATAHRRYTAGPDPSCAARTKVPICSFFESGRQDLNLRPPGPQPGALPDCATPRGASVAMIPASHRARPATFRNRKASTSSVTRRGRARGCSRQAQSCGADGRRLGPLRLRHPAGVAQLVERQPSKLNVAGSNPVARLSENPANGGVFFVPGRRIPDLDDGRSARAQHLRSGTGRRINPASISRRRSR